MPDIVFYWVETPGGNIDHIAEHDLEPEDVENAYLTADEFTTSRASGRPAFKGLARDGRYIFVVYDQLDENTVYVVTAYEID